MKYHFSLEFKVFDAKRVSVALGGWEMRPIEGHLVTEEDAQSDALGP